jgi:putative ABC transport system permease protein
VDTPDQVLASLGFIAGSIALSLWQKLDLVGPIVVATGRSILQMIVFSYLLALVFAVQSPVVTAIAALGLITIASLLLNNQINERVPFLLPILSGSLLLSSFVTLFYTEAFVTPSWGGLEAKSILPFLGMMLSSMSASGIAVSQLIKTLNTRRLEIETHLSLGATPEQAIASYRQNAVRSALLPQLSALMLLGLGVLPAFLSGELIAGVNVLQAGAFQLLVLFMSLFATLLTTVLTTIGVSRQFLTKADQLITW